MATLASRPAQTEVNMPVPTGLGDAVPARTWVAVIGAALGAFLAILNIQIVGSSLADIQGAIGAGSDEGGWITTAYLVAEIIVIPMSGWLARVFSVRTYLLTNVVAFLILSVGCAFATDLGQMIVIRALQGFAGGVLIPLAFSIIMTKLPPSKHPIGLSIYSVSAIFAPAIGPVIGGYFNETFGWQSIFYINLLPGAIMLAMLWLSLDPEPRQLHLLRRGDWTGIATVAIGLSALETVLEEGNKDDWFGSPFIVRLAVIAAVALATFVVVEFRKAEPLLNLRLLGRRNFGLGTLANFFFGLSMYSWIYLVPLYLARLQGYNAEEIGTVLIWIGLPQLAILPLVPRLMKFVDPRRLAAIGFGLFIVGSLLATAFSGDFSGPQFLHANLVRAVGIALVMTPLSAVTVAGIERAQAGSAAAVFNMTRNLGGAIGIALLQTFLTKRTQFHSEVVTSGVSLLDAPTQDRLAQVTDRYVRLGQMDPDLARHQAVVAISRIVHRQASLLAFSDTIFLQTGLLGLALLGVLFLRKVPAGPAGEAH